MPTRSLLLCVLVVSCACTNATKGTFRDPSGYFTPVPPVDPACASLLWLHLWNEGTGQPASPYHGVLRFEDPSTPLGFVDQPLSSLEMVGDSLVFRSSTPSGSTVVFSGKFTSDGVFWNSLPDSSQPLSGLATVKAPARPEERCHLVFWYTQGD